MNSPDLLKTLITKPKTVAQIDNKFDLKVSNNLVNAKISAGRKRKIG